MPRSRGHRLTRPRALVGATALAGLAGALLNACQTDSATPSCRLQQEIELPGTPLTLLPGARLDQVGGGFVLIGYDGQQVRWATVDLTGLLGTEQNVALAPPAAGPWFGLTGVSAPGDTLLMAYGQPSANPGAIDLFVSLAPSDGASAPVSGMLATVPGPIGAGGTLVAMGSGRAGMQAGLAVAVAGQPQVTFWSLRGHDLAAAPLTQSTAGAQIDCLAFGPGAGDLTLGYLTEQLPDDPDPTWGILELDQSGQSVSAVGLPLGTVHPTCPLTTATSGGYAVAWQNDIGSFLELYDRGSNAITSSLLAGAVAFGGADLQPPLVGLGPVTSGYAVVFAEVNAAEAWHVDEPGSHLAPGTLVFPSQNGQIGQVSSLPLGGSVYATYADYTALSSGVGTAGQRFLVKVSCF
jgi:hypothetical protein